MPYFIARKPNGEFFLREGQLSDFEYIVPLGKRGLDLVLGIKIKGKDLVIVQSGKDGSCEPRERDFLDIYDVLPKSDSWRDSDDIVWFDPLSIEALEC